MPRSASPPPPKRARLTQSPSSQIHQNSNRPNGQMRDSLPPLSLSILGVEPLDEFIKEIADFIHHMIFTRPDIAGNVEVEAKIGILRDRMSGQRIVLPVLVETGMQLLPPLVVLFLPQRTQFWRQIAWNAVSNPTCPWYVPPYTRERSSSEQEGRRTNTSTTTTY